MSLRGSTISFLFCFPSLEILFKNSFLFNFSSFRIILLVGIVELLAYEL